MPNTKPVNDNASVTELDPRPRRGGGARPRPPGRLHLPQPGGRGARRVRRAQGGRVRRGDATTASRSSRPPSCAARSSTRSAFGLIGRRPRGGSAPRRQGRDARGPDRDAARPEGDPRPPPRTSWSARDLALLELTGGRLHVQHVSTRGAVRALREAKRRGLAVTAEADAPPPRPHRRGRGRLRLLDRLQDEPAAPLGRRRRGRARGARRRYDRRHRDRPRAALARSRRTSSSTRR